MDTATLLQHLDEAAKGARPRRWLPPVRRHLSGRCTWTPRRWLCTALELPGQAWTLTGYTTA